MRNVKAHYIRKNDAARIPERWIILDTESTRERDKKGEVQRWNLAVCTFIVWTKTGSINQQTLRFDTPAELWEAISAFTRPGRRTVLYAHNLNYDLRISHALSMLPRFGWTMRDMRLDGRGSWSKWSRDKASLNLCDSASIFPVSLDLLASALGMSKPPLPRSNQREKLFLRCEADVAILTDAVIRYVSWLRTGRCGNWQMTGASQAWSHWRHSHYTHPILVHNDDVALAAERAAMHAGRCEAWKWGNYAKTVWYEYDWQNSYPRIARDSSLPTRLVGTVTNPSAKSLDTLRSKYCVLAEGEVTTETPCVPASYGGRVIWPTGTFTTTLWDPEIGLLREAGADFRVRRAWLYKREPALKEWAEWIISSLHDLSSTCEPWKKLILKHWSRALIGRFGMRYASWEKFGTAPDSRVYMSTLYDSDDGHSTELLQIGSDLFTSGELKEIDDGCPQITGYIMSVARAKLWRAMVLVGLGNVLYVDTDSLVVNAAGHDYIQCMDGLPLFDGLRTKGRYTRAEVYGPRSLILAGKPVVSGMPRGSTKVGTRSWSGEVWRGAKESVRLGEHDSVVIRTTDFNLRYNSKRRAFVNGGATASYRLPDMQADIERVHRPKRPRKSLANDYPSLRSLPKAKKGPA